VSDSRRYEKLAGMFVRVSHLLAASSLIWGLQTARASASQTMVDTGVPADCPAGPDMDVKGALKIPITLTHPWTDSGVQVKKGQRYSVSACGIMNWFTNHCNNQCLSTPDGVDCPYVGFAAQGLPCWSLIAKVGDSAPEFVGSSHILVAPEDGELYLGVNDNNYPDNTGGWLAKISPVDCTLHLGLDLDKANKIAVRPVQWSLKGGRLRGYTSEYAYTTLNNFAGYGITIPDALVSSQTPADPNFEHFWVQNMVTWSGFATYADGGQINVPVGSFKPAPPWLDANDRVYFNSRINSAISEPLNVYLNGLSLGDSPDVFVPLTRNGSPVTRVDLHKGFISYLGCTTVADLNFYHDPDPRRLFRTIASVAWSVHFGASISNLHLDPKTNDGVATITPDADADDVKNGPFVETSSPPLTLNFPTATYMTNTFGPR